MPYTCFPIFRFLFKNMSRSFRTFLVPLAFTHTPLMWHKDLSRGERDFLGNRIREVHNLEQPISKIEKLFRVQVKTRIFAILDLLYPTPAMANLPMFLTLISLLPFLCYSFSPENPTDRRILVVLDDIGLKSSHSIFFKSLQTRGSELDFKLADDPKISLQRYGQYLYDGLILFSPTTEREHYESA